MYKGTEAGHQQVECVAEKHNQHKRDELPGRIVTEQESSEYVESVSKHSTCKSESIEAYIAQYITEQACYHIVSVPKA